MESKYFTTSDVVSSDRVLYTPSSFARTSLLYLQEIGTLQALKPHTSSRSNLSSFLFFTVLSGSGFLTYNGEKYELKTGDMVFIDCRKPYSHTTGNTADTGEEDSQRREDVLWKLRWCHFNGPTLPAIYAKYCERGGKATFHPSSADKFTDVLDQLYKEASGSDYIRDMKINGLLSELCTLLMAESWHPEDIRPSSKKMSVVDVKEYLDQNYAESITLDDLATQFFINKYYLTRVFKEQYGLSISSYLQNLRITHAKQLLRFSEKTIEQIGIECGLGSPNYFSRVFKEIEGVPPSVYRSQW